MKTEIDEIAAGVYRLSTFLPSIGPTGFTFNQFLIDAEQPLLFHYGHRAMFPLVSAAVKSVMPLRIGAREATVTGEIADAAIATRMPAAFLPAPSLAYRLQATLQF